jgi:hypothetical protein
MRGKAAGAAWRLRLRHERLRGSLTFHDRHGSEAPPRRRQQWTRPLATGLFFSHTPD